VARLLECRLNGRDRADAVADNVLLLDYLREKVGLTGTKTGCDGGECGACTVLIDERPVLSCLTLASCAHGRRVDTVESLGHDGRLSAVQRGFHEKLGSQCGYCTPGFIMASVGLLRNRRGARQQYLPLHRLCEDHRSRAVRRRAQRARGVGVMQSRAKPIDVMRGLDPRIHDEPPNGRSFRRTVRRGFMDCRVKPGNDRGERLFATSPGAVA